MSTQLLKRKISFKIINQIVMASNTERSSTRFVSQGSAVGSMNNSLKATDKLCIDGSYNNQNNISFNNRKKY